PGPRCRRTPPAATPGRPGRPPPAAPADAADHSRLPPRPLQALLDPVLHALRLTGPFGPWPVHQADRRRVRRRRTLSDQHQVEDPLLHRAQPGSDSRYNISGPVLLLRTDELERRTVVPPLRLPAR